MQYEKAKTKLLFHYPTCNLPKEKMTFTSLRCTLSKWCFLWFSDALMQSKLQLKKIWDFYSNASNANNALIKATPTQIQKHLNENVFHFSLLNE